MKNMPKYPMSVLVIAFLALVFVSAAFAAPGEKVLYRFPNNGNRGAYPTSVPILDNAGNLYATTPSGGPASAGVVFQLVPPVKKGGAWTQTIIHSFAGETEAAGGPFSGVIADAAGNLYGVTYAGGSNKWGFVFELSPPQTKGGKWTEHVLYSFQGGEDGGHSYAGLVFDPSGNLYGTTSAGNFPNYGTVFKLAPTGSGVWKETVLFDFNGGVSGSVPTSGLAIDKKGNLYGTTLDGGAFGGGVVFRLAPPAVRGKAWKQTVLYSFCRLSNCTDGQNPWAGVVLDTKGNLYGTTYTGGVNADCGFAVQTCGTVFKLAPPAHKGGAWTETVLSSFTAGGSDGFYPWATPVFDSKGNLYGTAEMGGMGGAHCAFGCGVVFELTPPKTKGGEWLQTVLHRFSGEVGHDEGIPETGLAVDGRDHLFGTAAYIQNTGVGTVFEVVP